MGVVNKFLLLTIYFSESRGLVNEMPFDTAKGNSFKFDRKTGRPLNSLIKDLEENWSELNTGLCRITIFKNHWVCIGRRWATAKLFAD